MASKRVGCSPFLPTMESDSYKEKSVRQRDIARAREQASERDCLREKQREGGVSRARTETKRGRETERDTQRWRRKALLPFFCCDCTALHPGLLLAIPARAQASSSLKKFLTPLGHYWPWRKSMYVYFRNAAM